MRCQKCNENEAVYPDTLCEDCRFEQEAKKLEAVADTPIIVMHGPHQPPKPHGPLASAWIDATARLWVYELRELPLAHAANVLALLEVTDKDIYETVERMLGGIRVHDSVVFDVDQLSRPAAHNPKEDHAAFRYAG